MKNALFFLDINRKINLSDYIEKLKPLKNNLDKYERIYCIITDTQFKEDNKAINNTRQNIIENLSVVLNMNFENKIRFINESDYETIFKNTNKLSNYIFVSHLIKSPFLIREFQEHNESSSRLSNILSILNLISEILSFDIDDVYAEHNFKHILKLTEKVVSEYNKENQNKLIVPDLISLNSDEELIGLDGNKKISNKFNNNIDIMMSDKEIFKKVMSIFTDPNHIKITDKGNTQNNPMFIYVRHFCNDEIVKKYFNLNSEKELEKHYENGGIGDAKIKNMLYEAILNTISPLQKKYSYEDIDLLYSKNEIIKIL